MREFKQALISCNAVPEASARDTSDSVGVVELVVAALFSLAGSATWPKVVLVAIRVMVAVSPTFNAGLTVILSSRPSMPLPSALNASVKGLVLLLLSGAIICATAVMAWLRLLPLVALASVSRQSWVIWLLTGVQVLTRVFALGALAAVDTIKSVSGVMLTVCPTLVAIELSATCFPLAVPLMVNTKGAVMPSTFTTKLPSPVVVAGGDILPLISIAYTVPLIAVPVAAVPDRVAGADDELLDDVVVGLLLLDEELVNTALEVEELRLLEVVVAVELDTVAELVVAALLVVAVGVFLPPPPPQAESARTESPRAIDAQYLGVAITTPCGVIEVTAGYRVS